MKVLFAGPSLAKDLSVLRNRMSSLVVSGPVTCGDIARATLQGANAIGIVDGRFEDTRAVWHKEILFALSSGTAVAGAASIGALRAAECSPFGMIGIGEVFRRYVEGDLIDDSDVAQLHAPAELGYLPLSDPWVNVEPTLQKLASSGAVSRAEFEVLVTTGHRLHYKHRTYQRVFQLLPEISPERVTRLVAWVAANEVDQKRIDALELVRWLDDYQDHPRSGRNWVFSETSHWQTLRDGLNL